MLPREFSQKVILSLQAVPRRLELPMFWRNMGTDVRHRVQLIPQPYFDHNSTHPLHEKGQKPPPAL